MTVQHSGNNPSDPIGPERMSQESILTTEQILALPLRDRAMFAIDLINELFNLHNCYSSLNYSRYMFSTDDEVAMAFEHQGSSGDLNAQEKCDRLVALLTALQNDATEQFTGQSEQDAD